MRLYRRILYPTDFSKAARPAFERALALAKQDGAELLIVHVMVPPAPFVGNGYVSPKTYEDLEAAARRSAETQMKAVLAKAKKAGVRATAILTEGMPFDQIVRTAKGKRADLIVIGTHGRTGFSRFFLGSVAERVVQLAPCPVLTVRSR
jgi:nucleotide-binding universal stress UspA family protein